MRDAALAGIVSFVAVLVIAASLQPPAPEPSPSPTALPAIRCQGVAEPECTRLAAAFRVRAEAINPRSTVAWITVRPGEFEACFTDGTCHGEAPRGEHGGGGVAPQPAPVKEPVP